ncbi:hypothetical protein [Nitrosophilus alvini]|uniref:hypothetical protein n=1 Tax=Nitrosophilus alvini TaxID=2714855 RepID=UPI00190DEB30|nr:hypothetical protein [Nitrosophilus alvini]
MLVVIPVNLNDIDEAKITSIESAKYFAFLQLGEGAKLENVEFKKSFSEDFFDFFIVNSKNEELDTVYELGARVLLAMPNSYVEDILEAFMFRELDEVV